MTFGKWLLARADFEHKAPASGHGRSEAAGRHALLADFFPCWTTSIVRSRRSRRRRAERGGSAKVRLVRRDSSALKKHDIMPLESVGHGDPAFHEALQQVDPDHPGEWSCLSLKGFLQGERLLRPARVVVASPSNRVYGAEEGTQSGEEA